MAYGGQALGGRIRAENIQVWNIVQGVTERAGTLTLVRRRTGSGVIVSAPLDPAWENNPTTAEPHIYRVSFSKLDWSIGTPVGCYRVWVKNCTYLQIHFVSCHVQETVVMMD